MPAFHSTAAAMRILHTSDWHLGQFFFGKSRLAEHQAFVAWLLEVVRREEVDAVIIAGDVFDTGTPPSHARELFNRMIADLHDTGATLVVLGGNHDSVATLQEGRYLVQRLGTEIVAAIGATPAEQVLTLPLRNGEPGALLCAVPYIRAREVASSAPGQTAEDKLQALQAGIGAHYASLHAAAEAARARLGRHLPIIATGHLTSVGASASESVREIYVGALKAFPTSAFPPADYIALGHIHRPQKVGGLEHIRYCGSPLALGFDELGKAKEVLLVDFDDNGLQAVTPLPVPCFQPMCSLRGTLAELTAAVQEAAREGSAETPVWLEICVSGDDYRADLQAQIDALTADLPVEVLRIRRERGTAAATLPVAAHETLAELSPAEVFARRLALEEIPEAQQEALRNRFAAIVAGLHTGEAA